MFVTNLTEGSSFYGAKRVRCYGIHQKPEFVEAMLGGRLIRDHGLAMVEKSPCHTIRDYRLANGRVVRVDWPIGSEWCTLIVGIKPSI